MHYSTFVPDSALRSIVECYWSVTGDHTEQQKIVPDGFPEIIFHFGDPYKIGLKSGGFEVQEKILISGQISRAIELKPSGRSDVFGIKFKPSGPSKIFGINMSTIKDMVVPLSTTVVLPDFLPVLDNVQPDKRIFHIETFFKSLKDFPWCENKVDTIVKTLDELDGNISIERLCDLHHVSARTLQRLFLKHVGVSAKQYARIVRFRKVYALLKKPELTKTDSVFLAGYFDQPHFYKEFKTFTDENPEKWFSSRHDFANLFLNR